MILIGVFALLAGLVAVVAMTWVALFLAFSSRVHLAFQTSLGLTIALIATLGWNVHLVLQRRTRSAGALALVLLVALVGVWFLNATHYRAKTIDRYERSAKELLALHVSFDPPVYRYPIVHGPATSSCFSSTLTTTGSTSRATTRRIQERMNQRSGQRYHLPKKIRNESGLTTGFSQ